MFPFIQQAQRFGRTLLALRYFVGLTPMLDAFIPSLVIAASTVAAFVAGRVVAWGSVRLRITRVATVIVLLVATGFALFFWFSPSSRYALLLPAAFAAGFFMYGGRRIAPSVFDED